MKVSLTVRSGNVKVGPIPVSTTSADSCPTECPLKDTDCYARFGPLGMHWKKVGKSRGDHWTLFCNAIAALPNLQPWRHNQAGDLPQTKRGLIDRRKCKQLGKASRGKLGWTYTHYDPNKPENAQAVQQLNDDGLTCNLSADNVEQADEYYQLNIGPVVTILPIDAPQRGNQTPAGLPIVVCPAQTHDNIDCASCLLCQKRDRQCIVGFRAHGGAGKRLSNRLAVI